MILFGVGNVEDSGLPQSGGTLLGALNLNGNKLYIKGASDTNGYLKYQNYASGSTHRIVLAMPPSGDATDPRIDIGIATEPLTGSENDFVGGISVGNFGDTVLLGASNNYHNINTYANATGLALGGGTTNARQDCFQLYNGARLNSDASEFTASANEQNFLHLAATVNQSGSASYQMLYIEAHETSVGSGTKRLISAGVNSATSGSMIGANLTNGTDAAGYTPKFVVDSSGLVGIQTGSPTHALTLSQNANWAQYNTAVSSANYERVVGFWTSNIYVIQSQALGSGSSRALEMISNDASGVFIQDGGVIQFKGSTAGYTALQADTDSHALTIDGKLTSSSAQACVRLRSAASGSAMSASNGLQQVVQVLGTINQTSSASFTGLEVNITESTTGSGTKYLYDGIVGSASKFHVDDTGLITSAATVPTAGTMTATTTGQVIGAVHRYDWTNAMVTALGGGTTGDITVCTLPAKTVVRNCYVVITSAAGTVATLTVAVGRVAASYIDYIVASDAKAAANTVYGDVSGERGTNLTDYDLPSFTGTTAVKAHFIASAALNTVTTSTGSVYLETYVLP